MRTGTFTVISMTGLLLAVTGLSAPEFGPIPVANSSFETLPSGGLTLPCGTDCVFSNEAIPDWTATAQSGQIQPGGPDGLANSIFNFLPAGPTVAFAQGGVISQTVDVTVEAGVTYELMVDLGHRNDTPFTSSADLLVGGPGGTVVPATGNAPADGEWSTFIATFHPPAADDGHTIPFTIQLNASGPQGNFDDVRLAAVPEPGAGGLVGLGLAGLLAFTAWKRVRRA